jgi:hypothetical protein
MRASRSRPDRGIHRRLTFKPHPWLPRACPFFARLLDVGATLFAGHQRFFCNDTLNQLDLELSGRRPISAKVFL